jgi:hypothetical protein
MGLRNMAVASDKETVSLVLDYSRLGNPTSEEAKTGVQGKNLVHASTHGFTRIVTSDGEFSVSVNIIKARPTKKQ